MKKNLQTFSNWRNQIFTVSAVLFCFVASAQNGIDQGAAAIDGVTSGLQKYIDPITRLIYVIALILGIIGGIKIYTGIQQGKPDAWTGALAWLGAALFLLATPALLKAFFL